MNTFAALGVLKVYLHSDQGSNVDGVVLRGLCNLNEVDLNNSLPPTGGQTSGEAD